MSKSQNIQLQEHQMEVTLQCKTQTNKDTNIKARMQLK